MLGFRYKVCQRSLQGGVVRLLDVHPAHVLGVGGGQPGIVHEEVGVDEVEIHVVEEGSGVTEMREVFLDINVGCCCLPALEEVVEESVEHVPDMVTLRVSFSVKKAGTHTHLCWKFMFLEKPDMKAGTMEGRLRLEVCMTSPP